MDKTDPNQPTPEIDSDLTHLSSESAALFRKMTASGSKHSLRSLTPLYSEEDTETTEETKSVEETRIDAPSSEIRHFSLASVHRDQFRNEERFRSIPFPDLTDKMESNQTDFTPPSSLLPKHETSDNPPHFTLYDENDGGEEKPRLRRFPIEEEDFAPTPDDLPNPVREPIRDRIMEVTDLRKGYVKGKTLIPVLRGVNVQVQDGDFLSVVGQSGSGKSTLLHLMGTLDIPDSGTVHFDGQRIDNLPSRQRDYLRNHYIGMIFQFYHLIPEMTMIENVLAPLMVRESLFSYFRHRHRYIERAKELLDLVGLSHRIHHKPNELSGGEMQRTSIARALITDPRVLLADEPTGNLDSKTTVEIIKLLRSLNVEKKLTIIMVTHDLEQARDADRVIRLVDGQIVESFRTC